MRTILVTGGAGFIGSAVCRHLVAIDYRVINLDKLTYAGNLASLAGIEKLPNYRFVHRAPPWPHSMERVVERLIVEATPMVQLTP